MEPNTSVIATEQQQAAMREVEAEAAARDEVVEKIAFAEGVMMVQTRRLPSGKSSVGGFLGELAQNIRAMNRSLHTDTNMLTEGAMVDRARAKVHKIIREGNLDSRVFSNTGSNTMLSLWVPAVPGPPAVPEHWDVAPSWFVCRPGKKGGIKITQSASMAALNPLFRGADVGPIGTAVRADVNAFSMNAVLGALRAGGFNTEHSLVSFVEPLIRILLMGVQTQDRGTSPWDWVGGMSSRIVNPLVFTTSGNFFPGGPNLRVWGANDTVARIVNVEDYMREAAGEGRFDAGWGPEFWGGTGGDAVAVVPIRAVEAGLGEVNAGWTLAHMEYPVKVRLLDVDDRTIGPGGSLPLNANREYTAAGATHVPGPYARVLYVVVDQNADRCVGVRVQGQGAVIDVDPALNYVIGGADLGMLPLIQWSVGLGAEDMAQGSIAQTQRWVRMYGNEDDWESAWHLVSSAYTVYSPAFRRSGVAVEGGFWAQPAAGAAPFPLGGLAGWVRYDNQARAAQVALCRERADMAECPWGGYRERGVRPGSVANWQYVRFDPTVAVGVAAHFWSVVKVMVAPVPDRAAALADMAWGKGKVQATGEDVINGQMGQPESMMRGVALNENQGLAAATVRRVVGLENESMQTTHWSTTEVAMNGYYGRAGATAHRAAFPLSEGGTMRKRIPAIEMRENGVEGDLMNDDLYSIGTAAGYLAVEGMAGAQGGIWDVVQYQLPGPDDEARGVMNTVGAMGGWTRAVTPVDNVATMRDNGVEGEPCGIVMSLPTSGAVVVDRLANFGLPPARAELREVPFGGYQRSVTNTNHRVKVSVSGGRAVVQKGNKAEMNPVFVNRTPGQTTLGQPTTDTTGMTTADFLDI
uniref:Coat protein n=18 Tax=Piscine myocarditis virus TaxID=1271477 RepID=L0E2S5_9VIRU|nr:coat protein [Piscine myocarditis virus]AGA37431.1 coat protein [Piscine myocarditis virus]